jgi:hypothetical protein
MCCATGTDGIDNFGDLWVFRGSRSVMRWERLVAVGLPPCPRYGHQVVLLCEDDDISFESQGILAIQRDSAA